MTRRCTNSCRRRKAALAKLAKALNCSVEEVKKRGADLHEVNPMMGHRGVRLGITYPYLTEMQIRAILEAAAELKAAGKDPQPEIMVPVTCTVKELDFVKPIFDKLLAEIGVECLYGTMIEIPRAALCADKMAATAEFFSFGTNDLTQMGFGFSRDDIGGFLQEYLDRGILDADPFQTIDQEGVGQLIQMAVERGRASAAEAEDRHLRRAGRRPGQRQLLLQDRPGLRELLAVPRAHRPAGRRPGRRGRRQDRVSGRQPAAIAGATPRRLRGQYSTSQQRPTAAVWRPPGPANLPRRPLQRGRVARSGARRRDESCRPGPR